MFNPSTTTFNMTIKKVFERYCRHCLVRGMKPTLGGLFLAVRRAGFTKAQVWNQNDLANILRGVGVGLKLKVVIIWW